MVAIKLHSAAAFTAPIRSVRIIRAPVRAPVRTLAGSSRSSLDSIDSLLSKDDVHKALDDQLLKSKADEAAAQVIYVATLVLENLYAAWTPPSVHATEAWARTICCKAPSAAALAVPWHSWGKMQLVSLVQTLINADIGPAPCVLQADAAASKTSGSAAPAQKSPMAPVKLADGTLIFSAEQLSAVSYSDVKL